MKITLDNTSKSLKSLIWAENFNNLIAYKQLWDYNLLIVNNWTNKIHFEKIYNATENSTVIDWDDKREISMDNLKKLFFTWTEWEADLFLVKKKRIETNKPLDPALEILTTDDPEFDSRLDTDWDGKIDLAEVVTTLAKWYWTSNSWWTF